MYLPITSSDILLFVQINLVTEMNYHAYIPVIKKKLFFIQNVTTNCKYLYVYNKVQ